MYAYCVRHAGRTIDNLSVVCASQQHFLLTWKLLTLHSWKCYPMTTFRCPSDMLITSWLFTAWWSTWLGNHLVSCVAELVGSCIPIHALRCLPDPKCLFYPSGLWLCLSVDHFCLVPVDDMVLFHGMICDGWLVSYTALPCHGGSGLCTSCERAHFFLVFLDPQAELPACLSTIFCFVCDEIVIFIEATSTLQPFCDPVWIVSQLCRRQLWRLLTKVCVNGKLTNTVVICLNFGLGFYTSILQAANKLWSLLIPNRAHWVILVNASKHAVWIDVFQQKVISKMISPPLLSSSSSSSSSSFSVRSYRQGLLRCS